MLVIVYASCLFLQTASYCYVGKVFFCLFVFEHACVISRNAWPEQINIPQHWNSVLFVVHSPPLLPVFRGGGM